MSKQSDRQWQKKITQIHLEAHLLRSEGASRHIICRYMMAKKKRGAFEVGQKWCQHCSTRLDIQERDCPCCGYKLRIRNRWKNNSDPARKAREKKEIA